jgi:hypothetical protein
MRLMAPLASTCRKAMAYHRSRLMEHLPHRLWRSYHLSFHGCEPSILAWSQGMSLTSRLETPIPSS